MCLSCRGPQFNSEVRKIHWRRYRLPTPIFPGGSAGKESACNVGDLGLIPGLGGYSGEGKGYPLQYSGLENFMDCIVHGGHKESDSVTFTFIFIWFFFFKLASILCQGPLLPFVPLCPKYVAICLLHRRHPKILYQIKECLPQPAQGNLHTCSREEERTTGMVGG